MSAYRSGWIERNKYYEQVKTGADGIPHYQQYMRPVIVCLCGSTRFGNAFADANLRETLAGKLVFSVGCMTHSDPDLNITDEKKARLDWLHLRKIDCADEVLVLNVGGYVGESTRREVLHAERGGKVVRWLEPFKVPPDLAHIGCSLSDGPNVHRDRDNDPDRVGA